MLVQESDQEQSDANASENEQNEQEDQEQPDANAQEQPDVNVSASQWRQTRTGGTRETTKRTRSRAVTANIRETTQTIWRACWWASRTKW